MPPLVDKNQIFRRGLGCLAGLFVHLAIMLGVGGLASADEASRETLVQALRNGGFNIYFRHAATDWSRGDRVEKDGDWKTCDPSRMRQLSEAGRVSARHIGSAIRALEIPVSKVLSSEYCRAAETARLFALGPVETTRDIMNMRAAEFVGGRDAAVTRAQRILSRPPPSGTNVIIVGHGNLMRAATTAYPDEGGSGVFVPMPENQIGFELVAMLGPEDWRRLAEDLARSP